VLIQWKYKSLVVKSGSRRPGDVDKVESKVTVALLGPRAWVIGEKCTTGAWPYSRMGEDRVFIGCCKVNSTIKGSIQSVAGTCTRLLINHQNILDNASNDAQAMPKTCIFLIVPQPTAHNSREYSSLAGSGAGTPPFAHKLIFIIYHIHRYPYSPLLVETASIRSTASGGDGDGIATMRLISRLH
jgi:hypothetical protein